MELMLQGHCAVQRASRINDCTRAPYDCYVPTELAVVYSVLVAFLFAYFLGTAFYLRRAFCALRTKPYNLMRMAHFIMRLQVCALNPGTVSLIIRSGLRRLALHVGA